MAQRMARARAANRGASSSSSSSEDEDPWAGSSSSEGGAPKVYASAAAGPDGPDPYSPDRGPSRDPILARLSGKDRLRFL